MTDAQLTAIMTDAGLGSLSVDKFINNYVHKIYLDPSSTITVSCDYDYKEQKAISQVYYCLNYDNANGIISLAPAEDVMFNRGYVTQYVTLDAVRSIEVYAQTMNAYMKGKIQQLKADRASGKLLKPKKPTNYQELADNKSYPPVQ